MGSTQYELRDPPADVISSIHFSPLPGSNKLLASSWDKNVYLYELGGEDGEGRLIRKYEHQAPVLDVCWGANEEEAFSASLDWSVKRLNLVTGAQSNMSRHAAGVKTVVYDRTNNLLVSASWDCTLHVHHPDKPLHAPCTIQLPSKVFAVSISRTKLVVAMASRALEIFDLKTLAALSLEATQPPPNILQIEPWQRRESSLKFMTRAVACMPDDNGYASSSIEGRVAVEWFDPSDESQARKYAFKCHRQTNADGVDVVYPVNALAFHPIFGTFASGGGDGVVALWDGVAKRRIRQYQRYPSSVAALDFSADGSCLAVAVSPGFEDGSEDLVNGVVKVFIKELSESEAKGKGSK